MAVFVVEGEEYEILEPRGRKGRKATSWLLSNIGDLTGAESDEAGINRLISLVDNEEFLEHHLIVFVGKDAAKKIDERATTAEMLAGILDIINEVFEGFSAPEVEAAVKNSGDTQAEEK